MENYTEAVCNTDNRAKLRFPLEKMLRSLSLSRGIYVTAILDCCRAVLQDCMKPGAEPQQAKATDGRGAGMLTIEDVPDDKCNIISIFGCPPNMATPTSSTVVSNFFDILQSNKDPESNQLKLPQALRYWKSKGNGEILKKIQRPLLLTCQTLQEKEIMTSNSSLNPTEEDCLIGIKEEERNE